MPVKYDSRRVVKPGVEYQWTKEMAIEYAKCAKSVEYFALNQCKVVHPVQGVMQLQPRDYQRRMLDVVDKHRLAILNCPRQIGKSTIIGLYALWLTIFADKDKPVEVWVLSNKAASAQSFLDDIKGTYEELEPYLKCGMAEYNKTSIEFENGSSIKTGATSKDTIRGESPSFLILDEFAHVAPHKAEEFYTAILPTISTGGRMCIISTPNGNRGKFYELFNEAKNGVKEGDGEGDFWHFDMAWNEPPGRTEQFKKSQIKASSVQEWTQEYEAKFLGSSSTLISGECLEKIGKFKEEPLHEIKELRVWEKPSRKHCYAISCDVAKGVEKDNSVMQIFDVTSKDTARQVAIWVSNLYDPYDFSEKIVEIAKMYNNAYVVVENNTYGHEVCRRIWNEFEYTNLYKEPKAKTFGVNANKRNKSIGTSLLKKMMESDRLYVRDEYTYDELCGFIEVNPDIYRCDNGKNSRDDRVMALVWLAYLLSSDYWDDWGDYFRKEAAGIVDDDENDEEIQKKVDEYDFVDVDNIYDDDDDIDDVDWLLD